MRRETERRLLQVATALGCIVPLSMGSLSVLRGADILKGVSLPIPVDLDSHFRYLSGLLLGIGLVFLFSIPRIEERGAIFRTLGIIIVVGGLARFLSLIDAGPPSSGHLFGLIMELVILPLIVLWQARVQKLFDQ